MLTFGVFDHLDDNGLPLGAFFQQRLRLLALIERQGFYAYQLAEHHSTPLGHAASPSVYLAAAIERTKTIRLGPLVYVLPLYHPLRVYEEVCMLDHLSGGRLLLGVGRGGALLEHQRYGVDPAKASAIYHEAFTVLMRAFDSDVIDFNGEFYKYRDYVVQAKPVQQPYPPIFYGAPNADAIIWGVPHGINVVSLGPPDRARAISDRYRALWAERGRSADTLPLIGITRHIVVARTDDEAKQIARARYPRWRAAIEYIWRRSKAEFTLKDTYPPDFDSLEKIGHGIAGSPATVRAYVENLQRQTGVNYVLCQMIFGDMTEDESTMSLTLFGQEVIPAFRS